MAIVRNEIQFRSAISGRDPEIIIQNNISLTTSTTIAYTVTIRGGSGVSLFWASAVANRKMFIISSTGELTVESLILDAEGRSGGLVWIQGGKYTMNDGAILRNIYSRSSENAVRVGDLSAAYGGTFVMNGGLITGVDSSEAVFCSGGTVFMNNDAAIDNNLSSGFNAANSAGLRSSLTMTGHSRISNNKSRQGGSGGILMRCDVVMGVNEGDAPIVCGNRADDYSSAGLHLENSTLIMRYGAEISDNHAAQYSGGLLAGVGSTVTMRDRSVIKNNSCGTMGGGVLLVGSSMTMEDQSQISDNTCNGDGRGGGIHLQSGSMLRMKGIASINGNAAANGAGIYLFNSTAFIGEDDSSPEIYENNASNRGGGIFITAGSSLDLAGKSRFRDNTAVEGNGIYKAGILNLSQSPQILDGLFFDDLQTGEAAIFPPSRYTDAPPAIELKIQLDSPGPVFTELYAVESVAEVGGIRGRSVRSAASALQQAYTGNVPIIIGNLTDTAMVRLEHSEYVSPPNVPLVIADKGEDCEPLGEADRAAWIIPTDFEPGHIVILTDARDQVLIDLEAYSITYHDLFGTENPNPDSYSILDLPIVLKDPGQRPGHAFNGWYALGGQRVTEIPVGTTGDLSLTAGWERFFLSFDGNAPCVSNIPRAIPAGPDGKAIIPALVPYRPCYQFICWNMPDSGSGKAFFPGDTILISNSSMTLYAQWQQNSCCCHDKDKKNDIQRNPAKCVESWDDHERRRF